MDAIQFPSPRLRRYLLLGLTALSTAGACSLMWQVIESGGATFLEIASLVLFAVNFAWINCAFWTAMAGLVLRGLRRDPFTLARVNTSLNELSKFSVLNTRSAVVMPVYNEDPKRVFAGIEAVYRSLCATGKQGDFDFFILSDSTNSETAALEEIMWRRLVKRRAAEGKIFYRRRAHNEGRKAGNIADFCRRWGRLYDHMIVLDADSVMSGDLIVRLAYLMGINPEVGIIQTIPIAVNRETSFARFVQFAMRLNGPVLATGLCFWQMDQANYWGHNAIIRLSAFMEHCGLPRLPGRAPLGGEILSHDFVEAALMLRGGLSVWLLPDIGGSYEEVPSNVIDFATRDRRWCQGNLQHTKLMLAPGLKWLSRVHLCMGVMAYLSPLLWFILLGISSFEFIKQAIVAPEYFAEDRSLFPVWPVSRSVEQISLFVISIGILLVPKLLCSLQVLLRRDERRAFGGAWALIAGTLFEVLFAVLLAPVMMIFHSHFVVSTLFGRTVTWETQDRQDRGVCLRDALARHGRHMLFGVIWLTTMAIWCPRAAAWLAPVFAGLILSIPTCIFSSRVGLGRRLRKWKIFATPEELNPPRELKDLEAALNQEWDEDTGHFPRPVPDSLCGEILPQSLQARPRFLDLFPLSSKLRARIRRAPSQ